MNRKLKAILIFLAVCAVYTIAVYHPVISGHFDEEGYADGEVFTPINGEYDFRKFTMNSSLTENYTGDIIESGYMQFHDNNENHTIDVLEWGKMTNACCERINSSLMLEYEKPCIVVDNITVIVIDFLNDRFYGAFAYDDASNISDYVATPTVNETVEMIMTLKFK